MASVNYQHNEYKKLLPLWTRCDDVSDGEDAVKEKGTLYLPKLPEQLDEDYKAYKIRASFFNATYRTIAGLVGMAFRKPPVITVKESLNQYLDDVTLTGMPFVDFSKYVLEEYIELGKVGVLVDFPNVDITGITQAQAASLNLRPIMQCYDAVEIINWRHEIVNNKKILTFVVLTEKSEIKINDFESESETRYRALDLFNGIYRQRIFRVSQNGQEELLGEIFPKINGINLNYIPFEIIDFELPPLIDLVNLNLSHYRVSADYENGCHFTGLAQVVITGYQKEQNERLYYGGGNAWAFPNPDANALILSMDNDFVALTSNLNRKEQQMAILGARMLSADKKAAETAEAAQIHRSGEQSVLSSLVSDVSKALTSALKIFSEWANIPDENASIEINQDFVAQLLGAQDLTALVGSWQSGAISQEVLFDNLKRGGIYQESDNFEDEQERIASQGIIPTP